MFSRQNSVIYCFEFMISTLTLGVRAVTLLFWVGLSTTGKHISVWHKETNLAENLAAAALIPGVMEQSFAIITSCSKPYPSSPLPKWQWRATLLYLHTQSHIDIFDSLKNIPFSRTSDKIPLADFFLFYFCFIALTSVTTMVLTFNIQFGFFIQLWNHSHF